jgi:Methyl-accepting chemotaxis protein (MCP) signalling domain
VVRHFLSSGLVVFECPRHSHCTANFHFPRDGHGLHETGEPVSLTFHIGSLLIAVRRLSSAYSPCLSSLISSLCSATIAFCTLANLAGARRATSKRFVITGLYVDDIDAAFRSSLYQSLGILVVLAGILSTIVVLLNRGILRALGGEPSYAAEIANQIASNDLTVAVATAPDDRSSLLFSMKRMQAQLAETIGTIRVSADSIAPASHQIAAGNQDLSQRTEEQAASLEETAASMERVQSGAGYVRDAGAKMSEITHEISRVTDIMNEITAASQEQSKGIGQVNEAVSQMDEVTQQNAALVEQAAAAASSLETHAVDPAALAAAAPIGCLTSWAIEAVSCLIVATRFACASSICTSRQRRSLRSSTNATPWFCLCSKLSTPISTGTRLPSFLKYSFSKGCNVPVILSAGTHSRLSRSSHSGGVRSVQRRRPEMRSSRSYPTIRRNASLASRIRPSRSQITIPITLASTKRRIFASPPGAVRSV